MQKGIEKIVSEIFANRKGWGLHEQTVENDHWVRVVQNQFPEWNFEPKKWYFAAFLGNVYQLGTMKKDRVDEKIQLCGNDAVRRMFLFSFPQPANVVFFFQSFIHPFFVNIKDEDLKESPFKRLFQIKSKFMPVYTCDRVASGPMKRGRRLSITSRSGNNVKRNGFYSTLRKFRRGQKMEKKLPPTEEPEPFEIKIEEDFFADVVDLLSDDELQRASEILDCPTYT